jgi:hypothetical protein
MNWPLHKYIRQHMPHKQAVVEGTSHNFTVYTSYSPRPRVTLVTHQNPRGFSFRLSVNRRWPGARWLKTDKATYTYPSRHLQKKGKRNAHATNLIGNKGISHVQRVPFPSPLLVVDQCSRIYTEHPRWKLKLSDQWIIRSTEFGSVFNLEPVLSNHGNRNKCWPNNK